MTFISPFPGAGPPSRWRAISAGWTRRPTPCDTTVPTGPELARQRGAALRQVGETDPEGAFFFSRIMDGKVLEASDALSEESREVLVLSDVKNLSYAEIAKVVGTPIGNPDPNLARVTPAEGPARRLSPARGRCRPD